MNKGWLTTGGVAFCGLVAAAALWWGFKADGKDFSNPSWFVLLLGLFALVMMLVAIVFRQLELSNREEAFALPAGSVRTLLAVGVMVLAVVFGLRFFAPDPACTALSAEASLERRDAEVKRYADDGFRVIVERQGGASEPARLRLEPKTCATDPHVLDMRKHIVSSVLILLASVVSFYFGSRSAEGVRDGSRSAGGDALDAGWVALERDAELALKQLAELRETPADATQHEAWRSALAAAEAAANTLKESRSALAEARKTGRDAPAALLAAQTALAPLQVALEAVRQAHLQG